MTRTHKKTLAEARMDRRSQDIKSVQRDHEKRLRITMQDQQRRLEDLQRHHAQETEIAYDLCTVYLGGAWAFSKRLPIKGNPHPADTKRWTEWNQGWTDASEAREEE